MSGLISNNELSILIENNLSVTGLTELIHNGINENPRMTDDQLKHLIALKNEMIALEKRSNEKKNNRTRKRKNATKS